MCQTVWDSHDSFLSDPQLKYNGYQPNFGVLDHDLFYFTHKANCCGSTLVVEIESFLPLFLEGKCCDQACSGVSAESNQQIQIDTKSRKAYVRELSDLLKDRFNRPVGVG